MSPNTVLLTLEDYDRLKALETEIEEFQKSHTIYIEKNFTGFRKVTTDNEAIAKIAKQLKEKTDAIETKNKLILQYMDEISDLQSKPLKDILIERLKKFMFTKS